MIGYDEALAIILGESTRLQVQQRAPAQALGQVLAATVVSPCDLPPFDNSAMDGFALRAGAAPLPVGAQFDVFGAQAAGDEHGQADGGAWEIMTGARMPSGMDTVVPVEQVTLLERDATGQPLRIGLGVEIAADQHVRRRGDDVPRNAVLLEAGEWLGAQHIAVLAALGVPEVAVVRCPRVAIICTGRELVDDPTQALQSGQIRNSNGPYLAARLGIAGAEVVWRQTVGDDPAAFERALGQAVDAGADIVLGTGAVSMGRYDFVPDALRGLGAQIRFHKVRVRPGKPLLFARLAGGALFFGLPGNPVSAAVGLRFFVEPALRALLGLPAERELRAPLVSRFEKSAPLRFFLKAELSADAEGRLRARVLSGQESFRLRPLLEMNAWIVVPEDAAPTDAGTPVIVVGLGHLQPPLIRIVPCESK